MRTIRTNVFTSIDQDSTIYYPDHVLCLNDGRITALQPFDAVIHKDVEDKLDCIALPGFIDIHVHLSQYNIRGRYEPALMSWLQKHVFPEEARSSNADYAERLSENFYRALFAAGTTTSVVYTAPFPQACDIAFQTAIRLGARAFIGMTMMDQNSPDNLIQDTDAAYHSSVEMYHRYHQINPLISYIFTPRFALACSEALMKKVARFAMDNSAWIQTHLSENLAEIKQVLKIFGSKSYTDVYEEMGILSPKTILAHAIHLSDKEIATLAKQGCKVAHCPDSNFFLKSGEFAYRSFMGNNISLGLGSDVAAGTSLNMLYHAKMANYRQTEYSIKPERLFYHITLGNAKVLELDDRIGSLELGKEADLCFIKPPRLPIDADLASVLCFYGHEFPVVETIIAGRTVFRSI